MEKIPRSLVENDEIWIREVTFSLFFLIWQRADWGCTAGVREWRGKRGNINKRQTGAEGEGNKPGWEQSERSGFCLYDGCWATLVGWAKKFVSAIRCLYCWKEPRLENGEDTMKLKIGRAQRPGSTICLFDGCTCKSRLLVVLTLMGENLDACYHRAWRPPASQHPIIFSEKPCRVLSQVRSDWPLKQSERLLRR